MTGQTEPGLVKVFTTSVQETERVCSFNPGARMGLMHSFIHSLVQQQRSNRLLTTRTTLVSRPLPSTTRVSQYRIATTLDFIGAKMTSIVVTTGAIRHAIVTIATNRQSAFFTSRMPFLSPSQQCQSTEGRNTLLA